jgi:hypothetical protein
MQPDVRWSNGWEGGYITGHEAIKSYWTRQWKELDPAVEPVGFNERADGKVEIIVQQKVMSMEGKVIFDGRLKHIYTFQDGLIKTMDIEN